MRRKAPPGPLRRHYSPRSRTTWRRRTDRGHGSGSDRRAAAWSDCGPSTAPRPRASAAPPRLGRARTMVPPKTSRNDALIAALPPLLRLAPAHTAEPAPFGRRRAPDPPRRPPKGPEAARVDAGPRAALRRRKGRKRNERGGDSAGTVPPSEKAGPPDGWVAERFKAPVLKTGRGQRPSWVRIPPHPPNPRARIETSSPPPPFRLPPLACPPRRFPGTAAPPPFRAPPSRVAPDAFSPFPARTPAPDRPASPRDGTAAPAVPPINPPRPRAAAEQGIARGRFLVSRETSMDYFVNLSLTIKNRILNPRIRFTA